MFASAVALLSMFSTRSWMAAATGSEAQMYPSSYAAKNDHLSCSRCADDMSARRRILIFVASRA